MLKAHMRWALHKAYNLGEESNEPHLGIPHMKVSLGQRPEG